ncbi:hypothetical protein DFH08DRAFT_896213 [Mycena albidolilacea]|uniref:Uncharacterized protein n=1 Tax=Mycena albidolilacea TaxID=1033008 RepID=A0AAD6ZA76_9AGAR|nr:hypothetical protein DFH08DRAFT_896213 [Mycena albidolilacea]
MDHLWTTFAGLVTTGDLSCSEDIEMSVRPAPALGAPLPGDPRISIQPPLVLPTASQGNDLNTNAFPAVAKEGEIEMRDQAQEFLDALKLCPFEALEKRVLSDAVPAETLRASSIASSIQSSHHEPLESVAPDVVEEMSILDVGNFSCVSSPGSMSMVISSSPDLSPIPGLAALPMVQDPNTERAFMLDVQHVPKESDSPAILQLSMTLQGVRKEIEADLIKEKAILLALENLDVDVSELVDPSPDPASPESDFIAKVRVEMLRTELEKMLERRRDVELSIREIAMERRPPFVSPALMDTFIGISRLSTHVLGDDD